MGAEGCWLPSGAYNKVKQLLRKVTFLEELARGSEERKAEPEIPREKQFGLASHFFF